MILDGFRTGTKALDAIIDTLLSVMASPPPPGVGFWGHSWKSTIHQICQTLPGTASPGMSLLLTTSNFEETEVPLLRKPRIKLLDLCLVPLQSTSSAFICIHAPSCFCLCFPFCVSGKIPSEDKCFAEPETC